MKNSMRLILTICLCSVAAVPAGGQTTPSQRQIRTYVPPDQLVSFLPSTPFDQFLEHMNSVFERQGRKQIVDPDGRRQQIGISVSGMHYMDAFHLVLDYNLLASRETDQYFIIQPAPQENQLFVPGAAPARVETVSIPATAETREVQINALLFEVNLSRARETGVNWNAFFGPQTGSGSGGGTGGTGGIERPQFRVRTDRLIDPMASVIIGPNDINMIVLTELLRFYENQGVGETIANPQITVQSGEEGRIQIGSDIPIQVRDFAGNTVTQFVSTGIIIDVVPTFIMGTVGEEDQARLVEFMHLDVKVEKSGSRPSLSGIIIDRNTANTQVLLLNNEQTIIGGLYSTEEVVSRRGVPGLMNLPPWVFGLRYLFGVTHRTVVQKELLIVLQARVVDPLIQRADRPFPMDLREIERLQLLERLERSGADPARLRFPTPLQPPD